MTATAHLAAGRTGRITTAAMCDFWEEMAEQVISFRRTHNRLPGGGDIDGEARLDEWLCAQRRAAQQGRLSDQRQGHLDRHLNGWRRSHADRWFARLNDLLDARRSGQHPTDGEKEWLRQQRRALSAGKLDPLRKQALDLACPGWSVSSEARWSAHADELLAYVKQHKSVPAYAQGDGDVAVLYRWLNYQRYLFNAGKLAANRVGWLNANVPDWFPQEVSRDGAWEAAGKALAAFLAEHGHFPTVRPDCPERKIARWLETQRAADRRGKLRPERRQWLDDNVAGWNLVRRRNGESA